MKINTVSNYSTSFKGWRESSKNADAANVCEYYEHKRAEYGDKMPDFMEIAKIKYWIDKNTPNYDIYITPHDKFKEIKNLGYIIAESKTNPEEKYRFCINETKPIGGRSSILGGFQKMKALMEKLNDQK